MAKVARKLRFDPDIDYHLDYQFRAWESVPEYAANWANMDVIDQEVFHLEWMGITESRLKDLQAWEAQGLMTPEQSMRFQRLIELVSRQRPMLERMLNDEAT